MTPIVSLVRSPAEDQQPASERYRRRSLSGGKRGGERAAARRRGRFLRLEALESRNLLASYTTLEDTALVVSIPGLANPELVGGPAHGSVQWSASGGFTYVPASNFNGTDQFLYRAGTATNPAAIETATIAVTPVNDLPVAKPDSFKGTKNQPLVVAAPGLLVNDMDIDGDHLLAALVTAPTRGVLDLSPQGGFIYTPNTDFTGSDSFTYQNVEETAHNGFVKGLMATVMITIEEPTAPPIIAVADQYATARNATLTVAAPGVLGNDSDPKGLPLSAVLVAGPEHGTLVLTPSGGFTYAPASNYVGGDAFRYRATNTASTGASATSEIAVVSIVVGNTTENQPPVANNDQFFALGTTTVDAPGVLRNDTDANSGDVLTAQLVSGPEHGTLLLAPSGQFTYTPVAGYSGQDRFTYRANDGRLTSNLATAAITVFSINTPPAPVNDTYTTVEDVPLVVQAPGVLANDLLASLPNAAPRGVILVRGPERGTLTLGDGGGFTYRPAANYFGADSFTYGLASPVPTTVLNVATVTLNVSPVNDPPEARNDSFTGHKDAELKVEAPGVLANDSDPDNASLQPNQILQAMVGAPTTRGTLSLSPSGGFTYTPNAGFIGVDSFTYRAIDGPPIANPAISVSNLATVTLKIEGENTAPVRAVDDHYTTAKGTALVVAPAGVLGNDSDAGGLPLTALLVAGPEHGTVSLNADGGFIFTPAATYAGPDQFTYRATNSQGASATAKVSILIALPGQNTAPVANNDQFFAFGPTTVEPPGVLRNDSDAESQTLTALVVEGPEHGTLVLNPNGGFTYTAAPGYNGSDRFLYRASDGQLQSNVATAAITVFGLNEPPTAKGDQYAVRKNTPLAVESPGVLANDSDVNGDALTAALVTGPAHGTLSLAASGGFTYTPAANYAGPDSFTYLASDGPRTSNTATVSISVNEENSQPPLAVADNYTTAQRTPLVVPANGVLSNDHDPRGLALTAVLVAGPANGTLTLSPTGAFTYTPAEMFFGTDSFTYRAANGERTSEAAQVTIAVAGPGANTAPVANLDRYFALEDNVIEVSPGVLANDTDAENSALSAVLVTGPEHGTLTLAANGTFRYAPAANFSGIDGFTYRASDGQLSSDAAAVTITVFGLFDAPNAANDQYSTKQGQPLAVGSPGVLANDTDVDGDTLTASLASGPAHGTVSLGAAGGFVYTPAPGFSGIDSFTYLANDVNQPSSRAATVTIAVTPVEVPPSFTAGADLEANEDAGERNIPGWATAISAGSGPLANRPLRFVVTNSNAAVFSAQPTIDASGRLTFTPAPNAYGVATVTAVLVAGDGPAAGTGSSASEMRTFTIRVNKPYRLYNTQQPLDVDGDGFVSAIDAVMVINYLNRPASAVAEGESPAARSDSGFLDTDKDNHISAIDAVLVINFLNQPAVASSAAGGAATGGGNDILQAEGESGEKPALASGTSDDLAGLISLLAQDDAASAKRRRDAAQISAP